MPLNVKSFCTSVLLIFTISILVFAQTSADIMRDRVAKAKAYIAVRNYNAAIYELENIRRETGDPTVNGVINVLLVNSFLEQGDYKRAQDFLTELSKSNKPGASASYFAAASQVVKEARNQIERYRSLGLSVADPNLPKDAVADVDKMRETLEKVVEQTKVLSKDKTQTSNAMALMEEASNARGSLARDSFDANRWKNTTADAREDLANSRSVVINAVNETPAQTPPANTTAANTTPPNVAAATTNPNPAQSNSNIAQTPLLKPVPTPAEQTSIAKNEPTEKIIVAEKPKEEIKKADEKPPITTENSDKTNASSRTRIIENKETPKPVETPKVASNAAAPKSDAPIAVGSLIGFATEKVNPIYPPAAKNLRTTGIVKVELVIDENGKVAEVENTSGPAMLQRAATDAVKKWRFKPFMRDGQATKAKGFISFNFSL
ncbi:MAG: TonB family protein [Pyrinomonadaceae bacterium]